MKRSPDQFDFGFLPKPKPEPKPKPKKKSNAERLRESKAARDEAMDRVARGVPVEWQEDMLEVVGVVAERFRVFTSDDVYDEAIDRNMWMPKELRAIGPVMKRAVKARFCRKSNEAGWLSRRRKLHACPKTVWASLIYRGR